MLGIQSTIERISNKAETDFETAKAELERKVYTDLYAIAPKSQIFSQNTGVLPHCSSMPSEDLIALRKIAEEFARSAVSQQKIAEHLVTVTLIQSKAIAIEKVAIDRYGRTVAKVSAGGVLVNLQMVALGRALIYPKYFKPCQDQEQQFNQAQQKARSLGLGFWGLPSEQQVFPWEFRKK